MEAGGVKGWLQRLLGGKEPPVLVEYAKCPSCDCPHSVTTFTARRHAGNGRLIIATDSGAVVKCCGCGLLYTVLTDGSILRSRMSVPTPPKPKPSGGSNYHPQDFDADLEDLTR